MGAPNHELIPAAILYEHPGLTRDEFIQALDDTRCCDMLTCSPQCDWNDYGGEHENDTYHRGIFGLAEILGLQRTRYKTLFQQMCDETGFNQMPRYFSIVSRKENEQWKEPGYRFLLHTHDTVSEPESKKGIISEGKMERGNLFYDWPHGNLYVADHIVAQEQIADDEEDHNAVFRATLTGRRVEHMIEREEFDSLSSMLQAHPDTDPDLIYDFSQERGSFHAWLCTGCQPEWYQKNGRYFWDENALWQKALAHEQKKKTLDLPQYLYSSLVLTAEAIRSKAWNLLCYDGLRNQQRFLADFPEARLAYERKMQGWWMSVRFAKEGKTNVDMLRFLQELRLNRFPLTPAQEREYMVQRVGEEGFGFGRYLRETDKERFTEQETAELMAALERGEGVTPWIRAYDEKMRAAFPPQPSQPHTTLGPEDIPF